MLVGRESAYLECAGPRFHIQYHTHKGRGVDNMSPPRRRISTLESVQWHREAISRPWSDIRGYHKRRETSSTIFPQGNKGLGQEERVSRRTTHQERGANVS